MTATLTSTSATDESQIRFPSLEALRAAHGQLLKQTNEGYTPALLDAIADLVRRGCATGAVLDADADRWTAQSLLDYWTTTLFRADQLTQDATLAEFDPNLAPELDDSLCPRLIIVVGSSGSGKSSLVLAGLLPRLKNAGLPGSERWRYYPRMVPGSDPLGRLARLVQPPDADRSDWLADAVDYFRTNPRHLTDVVAQAGPTPAVLVVDQLEEVLALTDDRVAANAFIANVIGLTDAVGPRHTVIMTFRTDFEDRIGRLPALQAVFGQAQVRVPSLNAAELREVIEEPANRIGLKFEDGIVQELIRQILGEPTGLPLLQFTLLKLWETRERNRVVWSAYRRLGGASEALARSADAFFGGLLPEEKRTAKHILLRMVRPSEGLEVTSSHVRRQALYGAGEAADRVDRVLDKLIQARLVRLSPGESASDAQAEVVHEALVRNWPRLADWLEEERVAINVRRRLETRAAEWQRMNRSGGLLDELELQEAERWLASSEATYLGYDQSVSELVTASRAGLEQAALEKERARQRELEQAQALAAEQRQRAEENTRGADRLRSRLYFAVVLAVLLAGVAVYAGFASWEALRLQSELAQQLDQSRAQTYAALQANAAAEARLQRLRSPRLLKSRHRPRLKVSHRRATQ